MPKIGHSICHFSQTEKIISEFEQYIVGSRMLFGKKCTVSLLSMLMVGSVVYSL